MPAPGAVVVGPAYRDRPKYGIDRLGPVGDELRLMTGLALDPRPAVAGVGAQQLLQQPAADPGHRGPDGQLHPFQVAGRAKRARGQRRQVGYLGRELRLELTEEPPFSPGVPAGPSPASGKTGRASQIASFTSAISPTSCRNCRYRPTSPATFSSSGPGLMCADTVLPATFLVKMCCGPCPG
jgi:hypothetical protein